MKKTVIIGDNQDITYLGIRHLIERTVDKDNIDRVQTKAELLKRLSAAPHSLVVLDYSLFDFAGVDELIIASSRFYDAHWLLFSEDLSEDFLRRVIGISTSVSVILKTCDLNEISMGLEHALRNERYICSRIANQLLQPQKVKNEAADVVLTATEKEILKEIAMGKTTKEIAYDRNLSFHTIITHRKNIFRKLDVNNVHEAIRYAVRAGIVDPAEYYI